MSTGSGEYGNGLLCWWLLASEEELCAMELSILRILHGSSFFLERARTVVVIQLSGRTCGNDDK